jgi:hypothetical protein
MGAYRHHQDMIDEEVDLADGVVEEEPDLCADIVVIAFGALDDMMPMGPPTKKSKID